MNAQDGMDVSKIVSLIMENPRLIEEISALARGTEESAIKKEEEAEKTPPETSALPENIERGRIPEGSPHADRNMLLKAFKPYLSKERARALDSVISIVEILDMMRSR